jgi:hypothetical protein
MKLALTHFVELSGLGHETVAAPNLALAQTL